MSFLVGLDLNDVQVQTDSGNASTTAFTLDVASTTNAVAAYISGVRQLAGTDYSVSGTTITFTTAPPTGTNNIMYVYTKAAIINTPADNSVTTAKIAANAVDETKLKDALIADFTEVTVAAGDSILLGDVGDGGNTKRDTVQGILDLAGGGAWNIISTSVASNSASLTITGLDSTYDTYAIVGSDLLPASDSVDAYIRFGDSSGIDTGSSDYQWDAIGADSDSGSVIRTRDNSDSKIVMNEGAGTEQIGNATGEGFGFVMYIHRPGDGTTKPFMSGVMSMITSTGVPTQNMVMGMHNSVITLDRVQLLMDTGNITSGRLTVYGIAHA
jgi:hypothetical protein